MNRHQDANLSEVAQQLQEIIKRSPGIHFRSLGREAGLSSVGQLRHHLDTLRRHGAIVELQDGRFKRFFVAGEHDPRLRDGLSRFARRVPRRIAKLLLSRPMNRTEIRRSLNCADSTLGYHLNRMVELGDLNRNRGRNCCVYYLTDPDFVRSLLQHHPAPVANKPHRPTHRVRVDTHGGNGGPGEGRSPLREWDLHANRDPDGADSRFDQTNGRAVRGPSTHRGPQDPPSRESDRSPGAADGRGDRRADSSESRLDPRTASRARLEDHAGKQRQLRRRLHDEDGSKVPSWLMST